MNAKTLTTKLLIIICVLTIHNYAQTQPGWNVLTPLPTNSSFNALSFIDGNTGWIAGDGDVILKTTDGGNSWTKQITYSGQNLWGVCFADAQHGWVANSWGGVSATTDGGNSWFPQASPSSYYFYAMQFPDATHGFVLLEQDSLLYTTNGGTNWNRIKINSTEYHYGMKFINADRKTHV